MPKLDYRNTEKDALRCGGQPVIAGTRIRIATILTCYRQGMSVEEIVQQYASLKPSDVHDALAYAYDHLDEIEADLAADDESLVKSQATPFQVRMAQDTSAIDSDRVYVFDFACVASSRMIHSWPANSESTSARRISPARPGLTVSKS